MRELSQIDQELSQVRRDLDRAKKLDAILSDLERQKIQRREAAAEAFGLLNWEEEKEAFLASERAREPKKGVPHRERQEVTQARARYEAAELDLADLEDRLWAMKEERALLGEQESRYQALLKEKEQYLCCIGSSQVPRLVEIAKELGRVERKLREEGEALQAGEQAQARLQEMATALEQVQSPDWGILGGSDGMQTAQDLAQEARGALSRLRTELASLDPDEVPHVDLEGFAAFADYFLDGLFDDLFAPDGVQRVQTGVRNTLCEVDTLVDSLRQELEEQEQVKAALEQERKRLLAGA